MMRYQENPEDVGRCGCGRRIYCDGSHGLTEEDWQAVKAKEAAQAAGASDAPPETAHASD